MTGTAPAIEVREVSHRYASGAGAVAALARASLRVAEGAFVSLVGPSGCGKTTLLRAVAGLLEANDGDIEVLGTTPARARARRQTGLVTQDPGLLPWRTVEDNVALALELTGRSADVGALLKRVGIAPFARYYPRELSGGMRQRVALARALAHGPRLLLMDEPFGALDELSREQMRLELLQLWERDRASVLFVTHSIREAVLLSDRVLVMSRAPGHVVEDVAISLPRPRSETMERTPLFIEHVDAIRAALAAPVPDAVPA